MVTATQGWPEAENSRMNQFDWKRNRAHKTHHGSYVTSVCRILQNSIESPDLCPLAPFIMIQTETAVNNAALHQEEDRKKAILAELAGLDALLQVIELDEVRLTREIQDKLNDMPGLFGRHIPQARQMLRKLLDGRILCEPILEGEKRGYRFTATGTFDRLLTGTKVLGNSRGGGEGS